MGKKNYLMTPEERAQHDFAVKVRKMTDKQLYDFVNAQRPAPAPAGPSKAEIVKEFIDLCATKGKRMGPATICGMRMVAKEAGYDLGL
ncbi:MAG: hypothetical protein PUK18_02540 [Firmicutes bacterium]|nr:hypothetical protein [Bacillota bacterium]MDY6159318.1 hypothetical protein [Candidatus Faecousia sp.]